MIIKDKAKIIILNPEENNNLVKAIFLYNKYFYVNELSLAIASNFKINNNNKVEYPYLFKYFLVKILESLKEEEEKENKYYIGFINYKEKTLVSFELWCIALEMYNYRINNKSEYLFNNESTGLHLAEKLVIEDIGNRYKINKKEIRFGVYYGWHQLLISYINVIRIWLDKLDVVKLDKEHTHFDISLDCIRDKSYAITDIWFKNNAKVKFTFTDFLAIIVYKFKTYLIS